MNVNLVAKKGICSNIISIFYVRVAISAFGYNIYNQNRLVEAEQFSQANQAFTLNAITSEITILENGDVGKEITSSFYNKSSNPVFNLVVSTPNPIDGIGTSADHHHEIHIAPENRVEIPFPTLPPRESVSHKKTYSQYIFAKNAPRNVLNADFYFCFTDVYGNRWLADNNGA